jgi:hypothetical protein
MAYGWKIMDRIRNWIRITLFTIFSLKLVILLCVAIINKIYLVHV